MTRSPRTRPFASNRLGRRPGILLFILLGIIALLGAPTLSVQDPGIRTTPIDPDTSTLHVVDIYGQDIPNTSTSVTADGRSLSLALPSDIPDGVYSLVWDATTEDGTSSIGYSSFSVGNPEDASILTIPSTDGPGSDGPPQWLQAGARWSALAGILAAIAT